ncbi:MAG: 3-isopropylmalate dehydratase large subunit [Chloroflexi bacterium]|nr:3-isopropylmalate dehydratase large subunit [Chloroflexota bacterium]
MGQTLSEKILSAKTGRPVKAGDIVIADVDLVFVVDSSGPLTFREMEDMGLTRVARPERTAIFFDHNVPSPRLELSQEQDFLRRVAEKYGIKLYDVGSGICHQIVLEELGTPGSVIVGADSHSCTEGALCAVSTGMGASDVAVAIGTGKTWLRVPESIEVRLSGRLRPGVFAKDVVLELERRIGADGATYKALEFTGETVPHLTLSERATLCNMAVEMGGKIGIFPSDEQTRAWLAEYGRAEQWRPIPLDTDASYVATIDIDCTALEPLVACPHNPENVKPVSQVAGTPIHQVFVGTCTNARLDDIAIVAHMLKGRQVHPRTRLIVVPSSRGVMREALKRGYIQDLVDAGASVGVPSCAACFGMHMGVPGDGENVMSTQNRNFKGRMGNPKAFIYLGSPAVAAAAALTGAITDPREVLTS